MRFPDFRYSAVEPELLPHRSLHVQSHREPRDYALGAFTSQGRVAVLANALGIVGGVIQQIQLELQAGEVTSAWILNGYLLSIVPGLQNILDNIARLCQEEEPLEDFVSRDIYFHEYRFTRATFVDLSHMQRCVAAVSYRGQPWQHFANSFKHSAPWVGAASRHPVTGRADIYDEDRVGIIYVVCVPVYKKACAMLSLLGDVYNQPVGMPGV